MKWFSFVTLLLALWHSPAVAQTGIGGLNGVSVVVPVSGTNYQVDSGYLNERSLNHFIKEFYTEIEGVKPPSASKNQGQKDRLKKKIKSRRKIVIDVHVPAELPKSEKIEFFNHIQKKFQKWDNAEFRMQEISESALRSSATENNRRLNTAVDSSPKGVVHPKVGPTLKRQNNALPARHKRWLSGWRTNTVYQVARVFPHVAGIASASILITKMGLQSPYAVAIAATVGLTEYFSQYSTNRWAVEFNNWKEHAVIPFSNKVTWIRWFNERHFMKAVLFNLAVFATAKPILYRYFMTVANPALGGLTAEFFRDIAVAGGGGAIFGALGHKGFRDMVKNGYLSANMRKYLVWSLAISGITGAGLVTAGATYYVPYILAINWTTNGLAFLTGKLLPPRANHASVYHGELAEFGIDVKLKNHNEESEAINRQAKKKVVGKKKKVGEKVIEIEGHTVKEIVEQVQEARAKQSPPKRAIQAMRGAVKRMFPSKSPDCNEMFFRMPPLN